VADEIDPRYSYIQGRKKYSRPSGMLWSENSGTLVEDPASTTTPKKKNICSIWVRDWCRHN